MSKDKSVLVCGIGEVASATARRLFIEGYAVAMHHPPPPRLLRRRMCFVDAWFDARAQLDGVEARRADVASEFLLGLQTRKFIPLLRTGLADVLERWPWDIIVAAREQGSAPPMSLRNLCELSIGMGEGYVAGEDCDLVVETEGLDPGAILRKGDRRRARRPGASTGASHHREVLAPRPGLFHACVSIGETVTAGEMLGAVNDFPVVAEVAGRVKGIARNEQAVRQGAAIVEIALSRNARVAGISEHCQLISRGVAFVVEEEAEGWEPFSLENWL
ncbi:MAG: hypothetical protein WB816_08120 [Methylocystis sp.]